MSDPTVTVTCSPNADPNNPGECASPNNPVTLHIPTGARHSDTPDKQAVVVDQSNPSQVTEYDLFEVQSDSISTGSLTVGGLGVEPALGGTGVATSGRATAAGLGSLAGRVRAEEFAAALDAQNHGDVAHALLSHALSVDIACDNGQVVAPAVPTPGTSHSSGWTCDAASAPKAPPMGGRLQLELPDGWDQATTAHPAPYPWQQVLLRTMNVYGAIVTDTGSDGFLTITTESGAQYRSLDIPDAWWAIVAADPCAATPPGPVSTQGWEAYTDPTPPDPRCVGHFDQAIPPQLWQGLRLLAP